MLQMKWKTSHALACWISKATDTRQDMKQIIAFPRQQWLRERVLMLRYKYTTCIVHIHMLTDRLIFLTDISARCRGLIQNQHYTNSE
jgi:hypothetical protein